MPDAAPSPVIEKQRSQWRDVWDQFRTHKGALAGMTVLGLLVAFVLIGPLLWHEETLTTTEKILMKNKPPSLRFPMGTDQLGRDFFARMMQGGKVSIAVGLVAMMIAILLGATALLALTPAGAANELAYYTFALYPALVSWVCVLFYVRHLQQKTQHGYPAVRRARQRRAA